MTSLGWMIMNGSPVLRPDPTGRVRDHGDVSERIFQGFALVVPEDVWNAMNTHPALRRFSTVEILRTEEGLRAVESVEQPGCRIGENMIVPGAFAA